MNTITPQQNSAPTFGMAVNFTPRGKKIFQRVFKENQKLGDEFIRQQSDNKTSNITVTGSSVFVDIDGKKWKVLGSIFSQCQGRKPFEEMLFTRQKAIWGKTVFKTIIHEVEEPLAFRYGGKGRKLAIAEDIANFQAEKYNNKKPSIIDRLTGVLRIN